MVWYQSEVTYIFFTLIRVTNIQIGGRRIRWRPRQRWKDTVKSDMSRWGLEQEDVHDRARWHSLIELGASRTATR